MLALYWYIYIYINICADVSCKVLMKSIPVIDYIALLLDRNTLHSSLCHGDFAKVYSCAILVDHNDIMCVNSNLFEI